jgi:hypothetical protein
MARPARPIDLKLLEDLARIQCTDGEMAAILGFTREGFHKRKQRDPELVRIIEKGKDEGQSSLRRLQWKNAMGGNTTMQIWLGKQYLQQRDMHSTELTGAEGKPLIPAHIVTGMDDATRTLLRDLRGRLPRATGAEMPALAALPAPEPIRQAQGRPAESDARGES